MQHIKSMLRVDPASSELLQTTSRNLICTILAIYMATHFIATLEWPQIYSPSLWAITFWMASISVAALKLIGSHFLIAQTIWLGGLAASILYAYHLYKQPEIIVLLVFLPLMATVTVRRTGTLLVDLVVISLALFLPVNESFPALPAGYKAAVGLGTVFSTIFGWGLSSNLLAAIDSSTYHYKQARKLLVEARDHRAEISRMLKDQHQANYQLERLNQMLQQARNRAEDVLDDRDHFILAVSHELRSPLNFILGFSDLMVNSPETYTQLEEWPVGLYDDVKEIYRSSTHLLGLINDILDMGQIDARQMALFRENATMEQIVSDVKGMVEASFQQKGLWLRTEIEPDLPHVYIDCTRLRQVLLNLINNSLRFTEKGGVTIGLKKTEEAVLVRVEDTGSGIAPENLVKVFDEFRQVGQENWRRREGTGLGLSISRRFVQLHGGAMWLESELGRGSCFYFTIPFVKPPPEPDLSSQAEIEPDELKHAYDHQISREQVVVLLSAQPSPARIVKQSLSEYHVVQIERTDHLLPMMTRVYPRALLVDRELLEEARPTLKNLPYELPVLVLTMPAGREPAKLPGGVFKYLVKPVSRQTLVGAVEELGSGVQSLLVVDDDPAMLRFVTQALRPGDGNGSRLRLQTAATGGDALGALNSGEIDAVLLDLDLPDMTGWDVLEHMQKEDRLAKTPVIIVSAADLPQSLYMNGQNIFEVWMNRAISQDELAQVLGCLIEKLQPAWR